MSDIYEGFKKQYARFEWLCSDAVRGLAARLGYPDLYIHLTELVMHIGQDRACFNQTGKEVRCGAARFFLPAEPAPDPEGTFLYWRHVYVLRDSRHSPSLVITLSIERRAEGEDWRMPDDARAYLIRSSNDAFELVPISDL